MRSRPDRVPACLRHQVSSRASTALEIQCVRRTVGFAQNTLPPRTMIEVPPYGRPDSCLERVLSSPAQLPTQLFGVHRVATVMARAVGDVLNQRLRLSESLEEQVHDVDVGVLGAAA